MILAPIANQYPPPIPAHRTPTAAASSGSPTTSGTGSSSGSSSTSSTSTASSLASAMNPATIQQEFLQLLVAQLQNQDPLSPQDPTQFLTQLTDINSVEQLVQVNQQLTTIQGDLTPPTSASTGSASRAAGSTH